MRGRQLAVFRAGRAEMASNSWENVERSIAMRGVCCMTVTVAMLIAACGGTVEPDPNAITDDFPVVGTRCLGENRGVVRDACLLASLPDFAPAKWVPPAPRRQACNDVQLGAFEQACLTSSPTSATCTSFQQSPSTADCASCIMTPDTAPAYGPVIWHVAEQRFEINDGGCVGIVLNDTSAGGCGAHLQALIQCTTAACAQCPAPVACTQPGCNNNAPGCLCTTAAEGGACKRYVEAASCVTLYLQAGNPLVNGCVAFAFEPPDGNYFSVARTVCGGAP